MGAKFFQFGFSEKMERCILYPVSAELLVAMTEVELLKFLQMYAQIIDDTTGRTLVSTSSLSKNLGDKITGKGGNRAGATLVGADMAERAIKHGIKKVVFDRNGYLYHGRIKALSEAAREHGLEF